LFQYGLSRQPFADSGASVFDIVYQSVKSPAPLPRGQVRKRTAGALRKIR